MGNSQFYYTEGDTLPVVFWRIDPHVDLTAASAVTWSMEDSDGNNVIDDVAASIANGTYILDGVSVTLTPADGVVFWEPQSTDTASSGMFRGRFRVTFPGGRILTSPNFGALEVVIGPDI